MVVGDIDEQQTLAVRKEYNIMERDLFEVDEYTVVVENQMTQYLMDAKLLAMVLLLGKHHPRKKRTEVEFNPSVWIGDTNIVSVIFEDPQYITLNDVFISARQTGIMQQLGYIDGFGYKKYINTLTTEKQMKLFKVLMYQDLKKTLNIKDDDE